MSIYAGIQADLKEAMKARDQKKVEALRLITAAVKQVEVDERIAIDDAILLRILDKLAKQRKESISTFKAANRVDLIAQEEYELQLINGYLPEPMTESEINDLIHQAIAKHKAEKPSDMGKVMAELKPLMQGRADMTVVSNLVKSHLS